MLRRLAATLVVLLGVSVVTFVITQLVPSDTARLVAGDLASEARVAEIRQELGLDRPLPVQYATYMQRLARGDLGVSIRSGRPVAEELAEALPATVELALLAFVIILINGLLLGSLAALAAGRWPDHLIRLLSTMMISAPTFWIGLVLIALCFGQLDLLPAGGRLSPELVPPVAITGLYGLDAMLAGQWRLAGDVVTHLLMPALTLALAASGSAARLVRASLLEVLQEDHVRRARVAGLSEWVVLTRYALPNALVPFITTAAILLADLLGGAVVTEAIFSWPGLGSYTLEAVAGLDFPAIMGFTLLAALFYAAANLVVDVLYGVVDPRLGPA
ncbi:MAG: ABC transporter permease [Alphaproteobacteria bacterium]|nr:ABC transporter permease [Alphaproteobacteria bacterium]